MAIAIASGADPAKGLVTAIVAGLLISLLGGSRVQIGGPTGAFIVVVYGVIAEHGYDGLVIADFLEKLPALWEARDSFNLSAFAIGIGTMVLIVLFRRAAPRLPGLIVAVGIGSALVALAVLPVDTIQSRFGDLPRRLPAPHLPNLSFARIEELFPSALVIAFLAGVESLLSAMVADRMTGEKHRPNAEVLAQGAANIGSALFGGMPATGAIARTATNIRAGGRTPLAGIIHALVVLAVMWVAAPLAGALAMPALAGLLILTAWNMSEPHKWAGYWREPAADRFLLIWTFALTLLTDLTLAIGTGVAIGLALRLHKGKAPPDDWTPRDS